jgi:8-oxo-dGTP pyrophosphatase MutT (NUDIX family)
MREAAAAILFDPLSRLLLQLRDNIPNIHYPGKIGLFGGHREGDESFLDCVVREVHEELSFYVPPERFRFVARHIGPDFDMRGGALHAEFFVASEVPIEKLIITEGALKIVALNELGQIRNVLTPSAQFAFEAFLGHDWKRTIGQSTVSR